MPESRTHLFPHNLNYRVIIYVWLISFRDYSSIFFIQKDFLGFGAVFFPPSSLGEFLETKSAKGITIFVNGVNNPIHVSAVLKNYRCSSYPIRCFEYLFRFYKYIFKRNVLLLIKNVTNLSVKSLSSKS